MLGVLLLLAVGGLLVVAMCIDIEWRRCRLRGRLAAMSAAERAAGGLSPR